MTVTHGYSHGTRTHEHGYGFHAGVGLGGPKFTHGLPVTSTTDEGDDDGTKDQYDTTRRNNEGRRPL